MRVTERKPDPFDLLDALETSEDFYDINGSLEQGYLYATTRECYWWFSPDHSCVWVGVRKTFDRWANSRDFVANIPKDQRTFDALVQVVRDQISRGEFDEGWAQEKDIQPNIRKEKRKPTP